jgi:hypothetical protein
MQRRLSILFALLTVFATTAAFGQAVNATTGSISGVVRDNTGTGLPGVTVSATSTETGLNRNVVTENDGTYVINLLPPGRYRVDAELAGLGKSTVPSLTVLLGNSTKADLKLAPSVSETITVTAAAPVVDVTRSGTAVSVTEHQIENLPILGRDFRALAQLTPGIEAAFGARIQANGARGIATDYNIDGATSNNDFFGEQTGGTRAPFTFSQAAIKEFQVIRSQYDAEFGRGVGAQLNAITKSGTNDLAGEVFYYRRNRGWASPRPLPSGFTESFRARTATQPGFALGGPIVRDRVFYFVNYDGQRSKLPSSIVDIRTLSTQFAGLPQATQDQFFTKYRTLTGHDYTTDLDYDQTFNQDTYLVKFDANIGSKNHFSVRDNYTKFTNANNQGTTQVQSNQGTETDKFNQLVGQGETVFTNNLFNQILIQHSKDERPINPTVSGAEVMVTYNTNPTRTLTFGQNDFLPNNTQEKKIQLKDTVHYTFGDHTLKVGGEALMMKIDNLFPRNREGVFVYNTVAAFLADTPTSFRQGYGAGEGLTSWDQDTYAFYASDSFRVGTKWNFDLGLRYDWQTMPVPATNAFPQHPEFISNFNEDRNIAPRFGFAYDMFGTGRTVLRGGTGKFFNYMPDILLSNPLTQISGNFNQITLTCATATTVRCPTYPGVLTPSQFGTLALTSTDIVTVGPDYQAQEAWRSSLQFEQQIGSNYSVGIGGIWSKMSNVQGSANINAVNTGVRLGNLPIYSVDNATRPQRRYTDMGVVRQLNSSEEASYRALTLETHKLAVGDTRFTWDVSYTLAKSIDQDTNERSTSTSFLYDPNNVKLSEGPSDNDVRHRIVGNGTVRLPFGLMLSGIATWRTGTPYTAGIQFTGTGTGANSLNGLSQQSGLIPAFVDRNGNIIDLSGYTGTNAISRAGLAAALADARLLGRNTERNPNFWNVDMRLAKMFGLPGGTQLQLLVEAFNVANTKNRLVTGTSQQYWVSTYNLTTDRYTFARGATFGQENAYQGDPRQYQLGAKFTF